MISTIALFWALCVVCLVNMARYFSSLRSLLAVLRYRDHHDDEFIRRCERVRRQFVLTSGLCFLVVVSLIGLAIWH